MSDCYRETPRTARKAHRCCECMDTIDKGERYVVCSGVSEGEGWGYKLCAFCCALARETFAACEVPDEDGPKFCGLREWLYEWFRGAVDPAALLAELFPLVEAAYLQHQVDGYATSALKSPKGSAARRIFVGWRMNAQFRLRALRASRWTVAAC